MKPSYIFIFSIFIFLFKSSLTFADCTSVRSQQGAPNNYPCCSDANYSVSSGYCMAPASTYQFTLDQFGFEKDDGTVVWTGSTTSFDAASVGIGQAMGNFISNAVLPAGTYVAEVVKMHEAINVSTSSVFEQSNTYSCTLSTTGNWAGTYSACAAPGYPTAAHPNPCTNGSLLIMRSTQLGNFTVTNGQSMTISFTFYPEEGAICHFPGGGNADGIQVGQLAVNMSLQT
ncbi:MAG: hypothetical protein KGK03_09105 [Candidatus Omnitrophica bacterium]|nr:hypothetical protein [Candidatus Omnitrophota bacterium]MDE2223211.1 hypothetical protein [Candidatus Omnitrophota bacterium]